MNRLEKLKKLETLVKKMMRREEIYGCGFYSDPEWQKAYEDIGLMFGVDDAWREAVLKKQRAIDDREFKKNYPNHPIFKDGIKREGAIAYFSEKS